MSRKPVPRPPEESQKRQRRYLIGAAVVLASVVVGTVLADALGTSRDINRARSNETRSEEPAATPPTPAR